MADEIVAVYRAEVEQYKKAVDELVGKVDELTKEEKKAADAGKKAFSDISSEAGKLSPEFARATSAMSALRGGVLKVGTAMKTLRGFVMATGIGALVVTITALVSWFKKTERGAQFLRTAMAGVGAVVNTVRDALIGMVDAGAALLRGDFKGAAEAASNAFGNMGQRIVENTRAAIELENAMNRAKVETRNLSVETAKSRAEIKQLNLIAEDTTRTYEERRDAARKAFDLENTMMQRRVALAEENLRIIREQNKLAENAEKDFEAEAQAEIALYQVREQSLELQTTLNNKLNIIEQQIAANRAKSAEDQKKQAETLAALKEKETQAKTEAKDKEDKEEQERIDAAFKIAEQVAQKTLELDEFVRQRRTIGLEQEMQEAIAAEQAKADMAEATAIQIGASEETIQAIRAASVDEQLRIESEYRDKLQALEDAGVQAVKDAEEEKKKAKQQALQEGIAEFEKYSGAVMSLVRGIMQAQQMAADQELAVLDRNLEQGIISREQYDAERRKILRKQAADEKTANLLEATIATAAAVAKALPNIPLSVLAGVLGAVQIGVIASTPIPQFADGVIGLQGAGTETSDSIPAFLSRGESVMTAAETKKYRPLLEGIRKGTLDRIIQDTYVRPAVDAALLNGFADIGTSAKLNASFNDMNLLRAIDRHRQSDKDGFTYLATQITSAMKRDKRTSWN